MPRQPVAAVRLSLFRFFRFVFFSSARFPVVALVLFSSFAQAQSRIGSTAPTPYIAVEEFSGYLARIGFNDPEQVAEALMRVEGLYDFDAGTQLLNPVAIVVHGPEVSIFQQENYQEHKDIVDLAARLSALGILDINVCEVRLNRKGGAESVYPFVGTVPFGPAEVDRLLNAENYIYF